MIYLICFTSNTFFPIFQILLSLLHDFVFSLHNFVVVYSLRGLFQFLQFLHTEGLVHFSLWYSNFWQLWHLSGFGMYISTLVIVYPIFI